MPAITGRVCAQFCQEDCNRGALDEAVSIRAIERYLGDHVARPCERVLPRRPAARREAGGGGRRGPGRPGRRLLPAAGGPRGHRLRADARGGRHAPLLHPRLPAAQGGRARAGRGARGHGHRLRARRRAVGSRRADAAASCAAHDGVFLAPGPVDRQEAAAGARGAARLRPRLPDRGPARACLGARAAGAGHRRRQRGRGRGHHGAALGREEVTMACLEAATACPPSPRTSSGARRRASSSCPRGGRTGVLEQDGKLVGHGAHPVHLGLRRGGALPAELRPARTTIVEADWVLLAIGQATELAFAGRARGPSAASSWPTRRPGRRAAGRLRRRRRRRRRRDGGRGHRGRPPGGAGHRRGPRGEAAGRRAGAAAEPASLADQPRGADRRAAVKPTPRCPCPSARSGPRTSPPSPWQAARASRAAASTAAAWRSTPRTSRPRWWRWGPGSGPPGGPRRRGLLRGRPRRTTVLAPGELVDEIEIPAPPPGRRAALPQVPHPQRHRLPHRRRGAGVWWKGRVPRAAGGARRGGAGAAARAEPWRRCSKAGRRARASPKRPRRWRCRARSRWTGTSARSRW